MKTKQIILKARDLAELMPWSENYIRRLARQGILPHSKVGSSVLFDWRKIEKWLEKNSVPTREEIARRLR